jgi:hypothetical protein
MSHSESEDDAAEPSEPSGSAAPAGPAVPAGAPVDPAIVERVVAAAVDLFSSQPTELVTVKWIALRAGVPSDVVDAHWTLEQLMGAALADLAARLGRAIRSDAPARDELMDCYERVVVRALLSGINPATLCTRFPEIERQVARRVDDFGLDERSARIRVSQLCALEWGWRLFKPHLVVACRLDDETEADLDAELRSLETALLAHPVT